MLVDQAKAMQRVCFGSEPSEADLDLLGSREQWLVYRDLVRNRLSQVIRTALARTKRAVGDDAFEDAVEEWFKTGGPKTRYIRYVPSEFTECAIPIWRKSEVPWVADLAGYEITTWEVRHGPRNPEPSEEFAFDRRPILATAVKVLRLAYPVHELPTPDAGYAPKPTILCVYRDRNHKAASQILNPIAADLLEAWRHTDQTVADSVQTVAAAHSTQIGPAFIDKLSTLIADFLQTGILLGGHSPPS